MSSVLSFLPDFIKNLFGIGSIKYYYEDVDIPIRPGINLFRCSLIKEEYCCGHHAPIGYFLNIYGKRTSELKFQQLCPDCYVVDLLERGLIRCCMCGGPIYKGDQVILYNLDGRYMEVNWPITTIAGKYGVGCIYMGCCASISSEKTIWDGQGIQELQNQKTSA